MDILHIGLDVRGQQWLAIVRDRTDLRSVGGVALTPAAREWMRVHFPQLPCYERLDDALERCEANAAIVTTPTALHAAHAIAALEAGLGVMLEPPFASSYADGLRIMDVARRTGHTVLIAQHYRYAPCERTLQQFVREGKAGTIRHVSYLDQRAHLVPDDVLSRVEYTQMVTAGAHHFDSLRCILGVNPVCVMARCSTAPWSAYQHGSTTAAFVEMEQNIHVQYHGSLTAKQDEHALWIEGDKGELWTDRSRVWWRKRGWRFFMPLRLRNVPRGDAAPQRQGTATLLDQFKAAIQNKREPKTNGNDNLWTLGMMEAAQLSDQIGKVVPLMEIFAMAGVYPTDAPLDAQQARS